MKARGISTDQIESIVENMGIRLKDGFEKRGRFVQFGIRAKDGRSAYARRGFSGRRTAAICWHGWEKFVEELFDAGANKVVTMLGTWESKQGFHSDLRRLSNINMGSEFNPQYLIEMECNCNERVELAGEQDIKCDNCWENKARDEISAEVYNTPWDNAAVTKVFCSAGCRDVFLYEPDFAYFWCDGCGRLICEQNPSNGWHTQYRELDDEKICLKCYQEQILENGVERKKFEKNEIPGMFFSWDNTEAKEAGYEEVTGYQNNHITGQDSAERFCKKAIELIDKGYKVIAAYGSMAIGGLEGYVTLLAKKEMGNTQFNEDMKK